MLTPLEITYISANIQHRQPDGQLFFLSMDEKFWKLLPEYVDTFEIFIWRKKKRKNKNE
jgi:hypothetical protein